MKKLIITLLFAATTLLLNSCGSNGSSSETTTSDTASQALALAPAPPEPVDYRTLTANEKSFDFGTSMNVNNEYMFDSVDSAKERLHFQAYFKYRNDPNGT